MSVFLDEKEDNNQKILQFCSPTLAYKDSPDLYNWLLYSSNNLDSFFESVKHNGHCVMAIVIPLKDHFVIIQKRQSEKETHFCPETPMRDPGLVS